MFHEYKSFTALPAYSIVIYGIWIGPSVNGIYMCFLPTEMRGKLKEVNCVKDVDYP